MENQFINFYNLNQTETSSAVIIFNILFAFVLAAIIVWVWRKTHKGLSYSQSFALTIIILSPLASAVMMVVQNNIIGAFALLGAFSLIRFRTIIKETRDVAFLFFSLTIGVASGTSNYAIALWTTIIISSIILLLFKFDFASSQRTGFLITFQVDSANFKMADVQELFNKYLKYSELLHEKISIDNEKELAYSLHFKNHEEAPLFMEEFKKINGVQQSYLITGKETIEY
ncbi:DUF4956 domain-containing protein [Patescibacteria group bacterium]